MRLRVGQILSPTIKKTQSMRGEKFKIMTNLEKNELNKILCGIIQYCIEENGIQDVDTIWEVVCDETDNDYEDYDSEIGIVFDNLIQEFDL